MLKPKRCRSCKNTPEILWHKLVYANGMYHDIYKMHHPVLDRGYWEIACRCSRLLSTQARENIETTIRLWNKGVRN